MKVVVLCSGGMDSVTALYRAREEHDVVAIATFDYGAKHNRREIPFAAEHAARCGVRHEIIALDFVNRLFSSALLTSGGPIPEGHYEAENMRQTVVPFRNAIMLAIACGFAESAGADALAIAAHGGDHAIYPDCREEFMRAMAETMRLGTYAGVQLLRPFIALDKAGIAAEGARLGVDFARTWSCYKGGALHCGVCGTCVERREAFVRAELPDPTVYESTPPLPAKPAVAEAPANSALPAKTRAGAPAPLAATPGISVLPTAAPPPTRGAPVTVSIAGPRSDAQRGPAC